MKKGKGLTIKISFTNRWLYSLIAIGILAVIGIGVYALAPGVVPNPGHDIIEVSVPSPCTAGQALTYDGTKWVCANSATSAPCNASQILKWNGSNFKCDYITVTNAWITYTTGYEYCQTDCRNQGGSGSGCYNAIFTSDGSQTSCVTGSAAQKKCYCISVGVQYPW